MVVADAGVVRVGEGVAVLIHLGHGGAPQAEVQVAVRLHGEGEGVVPVLAQSLGQLLPGEGMDNAGVGVVGAAVPGRIHPAGDMAHNQVHMVQLGGIVHTDAGIGAKEGLIVVGVARLEADGDRQLVALVHIQLAAHGGGAAVSGGDGEAQVGDQVAVHGIGVAGAHALHHVGEGELPVVAGLHPHLVGGVLAGPVAAGVLLVGADLEVEVGVGEVVEPAALGEEGVPHAAGNGDHLVGAVADGIGGQLTAAAARHLVARHALKAEDHAGGGVVEAAQVLNGHLAAAAVVAGGVVGQGVAAGVVLLQPGHRVIGGLRLSVVLAVAVDRLLIHVVVLLIQSEEAGGIVAGALAGVQPLKGVDAGDGGLPVLVQHAHAGVVQAGHIPFKAGVEQLVGVFALDLQLFQLPDLGLHRHIEGGVVLAVALAVHAVVGLAQVVGQAQEVKGVAVPDVVKAGGAVGLVPEHLVVAEGGGQHVGQGHKGGGGVLGLAGVGVVLAGHPLALGLGLLLLPGHAGKALVKVNADLALVARAGEEVHIKEALLALVQRGGVGGVEGVVDLVRALVKLQVAEPAVAAVVGELQVGEDGDDLLAAGVGQLLHAGAVAVSAHQHKDLVIVLDDIPQLGAPATELDGAGLGVGAVLQVVGGDDGGAVGVLLQHRAEPGLVGAVPAGVVVGA